MAKGNIDANVLKSVDEYIKEISKHYSIKEVYLFGSYSGKVNIKLMKNYKVKLTKKFNIDFPITGNLKPAIGFFIFYFLLSISSNLSFNL